MFLLDTNIISELRKVRTGKANPGVTNWADKIHATRWFLSVISLHELEHGVLLAERRDSTRGALLRQWLDNSVVPAFENRTLDVTADIARRAAAYHVPNPSPFRDAIIAATGNTHGMTIVTRNQADFDGFTDIRVVNPFT